MQVARPLMRHGASLRALKPLMEALIKAAAVMLWQRTPPPASPLRPAVRPGMCEAQRTDLKAAQDGKISWAQYFAMWGPGG